MPSVYKILKTLNSDKKAHYYIFTRLALTSKISIRYTQDLTLSQSSILASSSQLSKVADPGKLDISTSSPASFHPLSRVVDSGKLDASTSSKLSSSSSFNHHSRVAYPGKAHVWTMSLHSKVLQPRMTMLGSKVGSGFFARSSIHSPILHNCSYNSYHSYKVLLDLNQALRSNWRLPWAQTYSSNCTSINYIGDDLSNKIYSSDAVLRPKISLLSLCFAMQWIFRGKVISSAEEMHQIALNQPRWTANLEDSKRDNRHFYTNQGGGGSTQFERSFTTSLAFHFLQLAQYILPMLRDLLQKGSHGFTCGGATALIHLGLTFDCTADSERFGVKEKFQERTHESKGLKLLSAAFCLPHPDKEDTGGEDAYFICAEKHVIGVADGVGGWADVGVDAGEYARQLMNQSLIAVQQERGGYIDTRQIMQIAHSKTRCRGSSTACILALLDTKLQATNLGDSGFLVVRNGRLVFKSPSQQHIFNFPFQLENGGGDPPAAAEVFTIDVAVGDVIVAGTDGLFDNLYDTEVVSMVVQATRSGARPDVTAKKIASLARERAADCNRRTPYASAAQDAGFRFNGGKMDDITVLVSYVVQ